MPRPFSACRARSSTRRCSAALSLGPGSAEFGAYRALPWWTTPRLGSRAKRQAARGRYRMTSSGAFDRVRAALEREKCWAEDGKNHRTRPSRSFTAIVGAHGQHASTGLLPRGLRTQPSAGCDGSEVVGLARPASSVAPERLAGVCEKTPRGCEGRGGVRLRLEAARDSERTFGAAAGRKEPRPLNENSRVA